MISLSKFLTESTIVNEAFLVPELNKLNNDLKSYKIKFNSLQISHSVTYDKLTPGEVKLIPVEEKTYKEIFALRKNDLSSVFFKMPNGKYKYLYVPKLSKIFNLRYQSDDYGIYNYNKLNKNSNALLEFFEVTGVQPTYALIINPDKQSEIDLNHIRSDRKLARSNFIPKTDDEIKKYFDDNFYSLYTDKDLKDTYYSHLAKQNNDKYKSLIAKNKIVNNSKVNNYKDILSKLIKEITTLSDNTLTDDDLQGKTSSILELLEYERNMISYFADICKYENEINAASTNKVEFYTKLLDRSYKQLDRYIDDCEKLIKQIK